MKSQTEIKKVIERYKPLLAEKFSVKQIGFFGSYARGEASEESDIDVLVEFSRPIGWEFIDLKEFLENILGGKVDLVTIAALKPQLKDNILREVVFA